jgi:tetratricopeptide (TPR) repeat protein
MGFWIWGLVAIGLSVTVVSVSYRMLSISRHDTLVMSKVTSATPDRKSTAEDSPSVGDTPQSPPRVIATGPQISRIIGKEMTGAQKALQTGQWAEAIKYLEAAEAKSPLTNFDRKCINDFKGYAYIKLNNMKAAQAAYEAAVATGGYTPEEESATERKLFQLAVVNGQTEKAIEYGALVTGSESAAPNDFLIVSQQYYLQKDCKNSIVWANKAVAEFRKAGEAPREVLFQMKLQCASDAGDIATMAVVLADLIRLTHKSQYWNTLLRIERQDERDDHNTLMLYRIMYATGAMTVGSDYIEMAQLLGDASLPAEAQTVLEKAMSAGLIGDQQKERTNRLLSSCKTRAEIDKKGLAQFDAQADKNPAGELDVKLGEVYYGFGNYAGAVASISAGIKKAQVKHLDEAYVYLGLSLAELRDNGAAKQALNQLKTVPNISRRVVDLWQLYAETLLV